MRILFFSSIFPRPWAPNRGIYCFHLCKAFQDLGHEVKVISPCSWLERKTQPADADALPGLETLSVDYPRYFYPPGLLRSVYGAFMWAGVKRTVRRAVASAPPDLVISYWAHPDGAVAARIGREVGVPSSLIVGGSDVMVLPHQSRLRRRRVIAALRSADAVFAVCGSIRQRILQLGIPAEKVHVGLRGIDTDLFQPGDTNEARQHLNIPAGGAMLLFVGNLVAVKGLEVLLDACSILHKQNTRFQLYLIGEGPSRTSLEKHATRLGLAEVVRFLGPVSQHHLPNWYRAADLTVLSSHSEGIPNVLRESLACGTPFVATDVGGIREITVNDCNRLVPPGNPTALAQAIKASLNAPRPAPGSLHVAASWKTSAQRLIDRSGVLASVRVEDTEG